ncbi:uncharacterized protein LOC100202862 [Hydra vulgaris]|uniref:Uncharacterized protein LOC100202862 n=1 Tax=Hydra vulgaris TaxID=6087 RepID=A0ABM4C431_HYDVU
MMGSLSLSCFLFATFIYNFSYASFIEDCPKPTSVLKNTVVKAQESIARNATLIDKIDDTTSASECYNLCCSYATCNVALIRFEKIYDDENEEVIKKSCYLFDCKSPSVCTYKQQKDFAVIMLDRPNKQLLNFNVEQTNKTPKNELISNEEKCPSGTPVAMCSYIPCAKASCPGDASAMCKNNFCGGCNAVFYTKTGEKADCKPKVSEEKKIEKVNVNRNKQVPISDKQDFQVSKVKEQANHNEQELTVSASDEQEAPRENLLAKISNHNNSSDPYYQSEKRPWEDKPGEEHIIDSYSTPRAYINGITGKVEQPFISVPLIVVFVISLLFLFGLIYHVKCGRRGKPKKVAVDDGDYLINGMYL